MEANTWLKWVGAVLAHCALAILAALCTGVTLQLFKPLVGVERYTRFAFSNAADVVIFVTSVLSGAAMQWRWRDRRALFAWLPAALLTVHALIWRAVFSSTRLGRLRVSVLLLGITVGYSLGAGIWMMVHGRKVAEPDDHFAPGRRTTT
jgi:hypothetical protein